ncbi:hypothetical protein H632_c81p2 [Helicosporidium sp. ATCC 50920]|nr:hypothetical protein H632_c81p2 [Helicosporidium sp. ATCC 50920]|eukprot:KDD76871.1 hypothetical protein H632_c81p2 [Helicosporidium sp. ATCC 50920]
MADLGASVVIKGKFFKPGEKVPEGERKIYLHIQAKSEQTVRRVKAELKRILEESTERALRRERPALL